MNESLDLLENNELGALSQSRIGNGFVDDKKILHPKKSISLNDVGFDGRPPARNKSLNKLNYELFLRKQKMFVNASGGYLNASGISNEEKELRSKYGAVINNCEQGQLLLEQVDNEVKKYSSILTTTRKARDRKRVESYLKAAESQKTRIKNALARLKCEKVAEKEQEEQYIQQLATAAASKVGAETNEPANKTIFYVGIAAGVLILGAVAFIALKK